MSHEALCRCQPCRADWDRELTILGVLPEPPSPAEEADRGKSEYTDQVVLPGLRAQ